MNINKMIKFSNSCITNNGKVPVISGVITVLAIWGLGLAASISEQGFDVSTFIPLFGVGSVFLVKLLELCSFRLKYQQDSSQLDSLARKDAYINLGFLFVVALLIRNALVLLTKVDNFDIRVFALKLFDIIFGTSIILTLFNLFKSWNGKKEI